MFCCEKLNTIFVYYNEQSVFQVVCLVSTQFVSIVTMTAVIGDQLILEEEYDENFIPSDKGNTCNYYYPYCTVIHDY